MNKKSIIFTLILSTILSVFQTATIHANNVSSLYTTNNYSVDISSELEIDAETLQNYTSFYNDDIHIGITVSDNLIGENVTTLTETEINEMATTTLHAVLAQSGEGINIKEHALTTFSDKSYPSLYVSFEGSSQLDDSVYIEEYIITTISYKYTIVFSADSKEILDCEAVNLFKSSFTTTEEPLKQIEQIENNTLTNVLICSVIALVVFFTVTIIIIIKKQPKKADSNISKKTDKNPNSSKK